MRPSRFQFKIRHLIVVVAVCAVCFALLRTPGGVLILYTGVILPGFVIERSRGGSGILGGALSASTISASVIFVANLLADDVAAIVGRRGNISPRCPDVRRVGRHVLRRFLAQLALCVLLEMTKHLFQPDEDKKSSYADEIRWLSPDE